METERMKQCNWHATFWEAILILGSIPVFRSVWMLFDSIEFMNRHAGILLSFAGGILLCVISLLALNRTDKKTQANACGDNT
jgi:hypothetical protein